MKLLYLYLDGELEVKESLRVQVHLQECGRCLQDYQQEQAFLRKVKVSLPSAVAPKGLQEKVRLSIHRPRWWRHFPRVSAKVLQVAAAAVFVFVVSGVLWGGLGDRFSSQQPDLVREAVASHSGMIHGELPFQVMSTKSEEVIQWLAQRLDFPVPIPTEAHLPMDIEGGRIVRVGEKQAAFVTLGGKAGQDTSAKVSLLMTTRQRMGPMKGKLISFEGVRFYLSQHEGYYVLAWKDARWAYTLVSEGKEEIAQACLLCHAGSEADDIARFRDHI